MSRGAGELEGSARRMDLVLFTDTYPVSFKVCRFPATVVITELFPHSYVPLALRDVPCPVWAAHRWWRAVSPIRISRDHVCVRRAHVVGLHDAHTLRTGDGFIKGRRG